MVFTRNSSCALWKIPTFIFQITNVTMHIFHFLSFLLQISVLRSAIIYIHDLLFVNLKFPWIIQFWHQKAISPKQQTINYVYQSMNLKWAEKSYTMYQYYESDIQIKYFNRHLHTKNGYNGDEKYQYKT